MSLEAQNRAANDEGDERGQRGADDEGQPRRHAKMGRANGDGISADPHEAGMAEAHLPGKTHQQVQSDRGEREHEHQRRDAIVIGGRKKQWQKDDNGGHRHDRD